MSPQDALPYQERRPGTKAIRPEPPRTPRKERQIGNEKRRITRIGLTDDPGRTKRELGSPADWNQMGPFPSETNARTWERAMVADGLVGGPSGPEWKYAYWYTISAEKEK
jgi:hypothetical protein